MSPTTERMSDYHFDGEALFNAIEMRDVYIINDILIECPDLVTKPFDFAEFVKDDPVRDCYYETNPLFHAWSIADDTASDYPLEIVTLLLSHSDINEVNNKAQNQLHVAAFTGNIEIAKYAISVGVGINDIDANGKTPLQYANESDNYTVGDLIYENDGI